MGPIPRRPTFIFIGRRAIRRSGLPTMDGGREKKGKKRKKKKRSILGRGRARLSYEDAFFTGSLSLSPFHSARPRVARSLFPFPARLFPFFSGPAASHLLRKVLRDRSTVASRPGHSYLHHPSATG